MRRCSPRAARCCNAAAHSITADDASATTARDAFKVSLLQSVVARCAARAACASVATTYSRRLVRGQIVGESSVRELRTQPESSCEEVGTGGSCVRCQRTMASVCKPRVALQDCSKTLLFISKCAAMATLEQWLPCVTPCSLSAPRPPLSLSLRLGYVC